MSKISFDMIDDHGDKVSIRQTSDSRIVIRQKNGNFFALSFASKTDAMYMRLFADLCVQRAQIPHQKMTTTKESRGEIE